MTAVDRLAEIQARADAATEGQWVVNGPDEDWAVLSSGSDSVFHAYSAHGICEGCECGDGVAHVAIDIEDAEFIAASRTDVPALVAALRAVLTLCDSTPLRFRPYDGAEPFMVLGVPAIRSAIEAALGEVLS